MAKQEVHLNDVGTVFELTIKEGSTIVDVSTTTAKQIKFLKPSGEVLTKTASFTTDGTDGKIKYASIAGDLDEVGPWEIQAVVTFASGEWNSNTSQFDVYRNIQ
jgi:hypothetical protein